MNLMVKNEIQIKFGIPINVNMSAKIQEKIFAKKVMLGKLLNVLLKTVSI